MTVEPDETTTTHDSRARLSVDEAALSETLVAHLVSRLDEIEDGIVWAADALGLTPAIVVRLAQVHEEGLPDSIQQLLDATLKYDYSHLRQWRQAALAVTELKDSVQLFAAFADVEDDFEPFELQAKGLVARLDYEIELNADMMRGK